MCTVLEKVCSALMDSVKTRASSSRFEQDVVSWVKSMRSECADDIVAVSSALQMCVVAKCYQQ